MMRFFSALAGAVLCAACSGPLGGARQGSVVDGDRGDGPGSLARDQIAPGRTGPAGLSARRGETAARQVPPETRAPAGRRAGSAAGTLTAGSSTAVRARPPDSGSAPFDPHAEFRVRVDLDDAPIRGAREPLVTVVVFSDFECAPCKHLNPTLARLERIYPNDVAFAFRHNPADDRHPYATVAAEAAIAAFRNGGNTAFWHMHDLIFANQEALSELELRVHAASVGLDLDTLEDGLSQRRYRPTLVRDRRLAADLGVTKSPMVFVNGRRIAGSHTFDRLQRVVQEELQVARALMQAGVARAALYATLMAGATSPVAPEDLPGPAAGTVISGAPTRAARQEEER